jgi:hypothetical protein
MEYTINVSVLNSHAIEAADVLAGVCESLADDLTVINQDFTLILSDAEGELERW